MNQISERTAIIFLLCTMTFWAGNAVTGRMFYEELPPFQLAFWRWVLAGAIVFILLRPPLRRDWQVIWAHKWTLLIIGTLGIGMYNTLQYWALHYTTATNVGLIQTIMPLLITMMDWMINRSRVYKIQFVGMALSTLGVVVVISRGDLDILLNLSLNIGDVLMVIAVLVYGLFSVLLKRAPKLNQWSLLFVLFMIGAVELLPLQYYEYASGARFDFSTGPIIGMIYIVIGPALLAYYFFTTAVGRLGANRAGLFFYWLPIAAAGLAAWLLDERLAIYHLIGFILVVIGLRLGLRVPQTANQ